MNLRAALYQTIKHYKIYQRELSRRTHVLHSLGKGTYIDPPNLNKYLKGHKDIETEALESLIRSLGYEARSYFIFLLTAADEELIEWDKGKKTAEPGAPTAHVAPRVVQHQQ